MSTYSPIAEVTTASSVASVVVGGIPQTYTDLIVLTSTASDLAATTDHVLVRFNEDAGSNYSANYFYGAGGSATAARGNNVTGVYMGRHHQTEYGLGVAHIQDYSNSTGYKTVFARGGTTDIAIVYTSQWRNTAAVTSLTFLPFGASNFDAGCTFKVYGVNSQDSVQAKATGGNTIRTDGTYWYHVFTSSGTFTPSQSLSDVDYLVVAGGGAGGSNNGGGGGAGGLRSTVSATGGGGSLESKLSLSSGTVYTITVGAGGVSAPPQTDGTQGSNSSISGSGLTTISSTGGGFGAGYVVLRGGASSQPGGSGGSGGGGAGANSAGGGGGAGAAGGNAGGNTNSSGGARTVNQGFVGGSGADGSTGAAGGAGVAVSITGTSVTYAGGGGGCGTVSQGAGGSGGGGAGANAGISAAGTANTGGGGGGNMNNQGGNGGSGIVIVRYAV